MTFPYKPIDLTHTLDESVPTWNGGCGFNHDIQVDYSDCEGQYKFRVMKVNMDAGIGTHMDAPSHCIPGGKCIGDFLLYELIFPCVVIDVSHQCFERYSLSVQDVGDFENSFGPIPAGSCVMIQTGWSQFWHTPLQYHNNHVFPSVSPAAASLLIERGVNALGIDTLSPDRPEDGFTVHKTFLGAGKILIENVANLDHMPPIGSFVMVLPMKIKAGTEAPVRLVGWRHNTSFMKRAL
jgi:kynurenine formamidase